MGNRVGICRQWLTLFFLFSAISLMSQQGDGIYWHDAAALPLQGKITSETKTPFARFPRGMKEKVRQRVWELSRNSAGLYLDFQTNATDIRVRYQIEDKLAFPHMPATGVSGLDLYAREKEQWQWVRGNYSFNDTISYRFPGIKPSINRWRTFRLYLPLYNTVKWLRIGIPENSAFRSVDISFDKPVIIYGTSIVQGACASRPGMAWTSILGRRLGRQIVNLGFSGNGRLEYEIIDFMKTQDASVYVLDCMANFTSGQGLNPTEAEKRMIYAVNEIRARRPDTPILLVEHAGYAHGYMQPARRNTYVALNAATQRAYSKLKVNNVPLLYLLKKDDIGLQEDSFVDGTHPNDYGMMQYADALLDKLTEIFDY